MKLSVGQNPHTYTLPAWFYLFPPLQCPLLSVLSYLFYFVIKNLPLKRLFKVVIWCLTVQHTLLITQRCKFFIVNTAPPAALLSPCIFAFNYIKKNSIISCIKKVGQRSFWKAFEWSNHYWRIFCSQEWVRYLPRERPFSGEENQPFVTSAIWPGNTEIINSIVHFGSSSVLVCCSLQLT